jgi:transcriptional regulator with XRE-family HTH domain
VAAEIAGGHVGIRVDPRAVPKTLALDAPCPLDPLADGRARLLGPALDQVGRDHGGHLEMDIDPVEQGPGHSSAIPLHVDLGTAALLARVPEIAAGTFPRCLFAMPTSRAHIPCPVPIPKSLQTIGDHLRQRGLDLGLRQPEVAERLGVDPSTVTNWELSRTAPARRFLPGIINLLGLDPSAPGASLGECLKAWRHRAGVPQDRFARVIGIDPATLSR